MNIGEGTLARPQKAHVLFVLPALNSTQRRLYLHCWGHIDLPKRLSEVWQMDFIQQWIHMDTHILVLQV